MCASKAFHGMCWAHMPLHSARQFKMRTVRPEIDAYGLQTNFLAMDFCNKHI